MNISYVKVGLGMAGLLLSPMLSLAQQSTPLDEVIITTNRAPHTAADIGKAVRVITAETLAQSQGRTLPEVLNTVSGLIISGTGNHMGQPQAVYLRGAGGQSTLILVDGIPVNDASGPSEEYNISTIPIDMIARIEIVKGGNSTLYGSGAIAGVINIITKQGYNMSPNANMVVTGGSYNTFKQSVYAGGQIQKNMISVNASNLSSEGFSTAMPKNGETNFDKDAFKQQSVGLNIGREINEKLLLKGNFILNHSVTDLDGGAFLDKENDASSKLSYLGGVSGRLKLSRGGMLNTYLQQNNITRKENTYDFKSRISTVETVLNYPVASFLNLTSGLNYKHFGTVQSEMDANSSVFSAFTSLFFKTGCGFRTELGSRYNNHSQYGSNFTYTVNPFYLFADRYKVFVNWSSSYLAPSLYQLFSPQYGNINLKPELSTSFEAGIDLDIIPDKIRFNASYFDRKIDDVIAWNSRYLNANKETTHGLELEIGAKPHASIRINAFYTYVVGKMRQYDQSVNELYRRPKHTAGVDLGLTVSPKTTVNVNYKVRGASIEERGKVNVKPYSIMDVYMQYRPISKLTLFSDVKNVFNTDYTDVVGYTTKGLNFNAGARVEL